MLFRFCSFSSFLPRWFRGWLSWCFGGCGLCAGVGFFVVSLLVLLPLFVVLFCWLVVFLVVRRWFFVRFPRPWSPFRSLWGWFCVPASSVRSLAAVVPVWRVRPAVVVRRGRLAGLVCFCWVLACPSWVDQDTKNNAAVAAGAAAVAAAPAFA